MLRPSEVDLLVGDASKARDAFGWTPKTSFGELVTLVAESDLALAEREAAISAHPTTAHY